MSARVQQILTLADKSPAMWMVSFQDEVPFRMNTNKKAKKLKAGDYSYYAVEYFKQKTGLKKAAFPPVQSLSDQRDIPHRSYPLTSHL